MTSRRALRTAGHVLVILALIAVGVLTTALGLMTDLSAFGPDRSTPNDIGIIRFLLGWLLLPALAFYRSRPLITMGVGAVVALVLGLDCLTLAVGLTTYLSRPGSNRVVIGLGYAGIVANLVIHLVRAQQWDAQNRDLIVWLVIAAAILILGLVTTIGLLVRQRRLTRVATQRAAAADDRGDHLRDELFKQQEREDLAREVHDTLASRLTAINLQAGQLEDEAAGGQSGLGDTARNVRRNTSEALRDLRSLLASLREGGAPAGTPGTPPGAGLASLIQLIDDAAANGLDVYPVITLEGYAKAPDALHRAVFRISQEALTNAQRHGADNVVHLRIDGSPEAGVWLRYRNRRAPGRPFDQGAGRGLTGLRERVRLLGGSSETQASDDTYTLAVWLPWSVT